MHDRSCPSWAETLPPDRAGSALPAAHAASPAADLQEPVCTEAPQIAPPPSDLDFDDAVALVVLGLQTSRFDEATFKQQST